MAPNCCGAGVKTAIHIAARGVRGGKAELCGAAVMGAGYWVSTVGPDEVVVRRYIQEQEKGDQRLDQLTLMPL